MTKDTPLADLKEYRRFFDGKADINDENIRIFLSRFAGKVEAEESIP